MSETETQLKNDVDFEEVVTENLVDLEKAYMALDELINQYCWNYKPDARKAIEFSETVNAMEYCDEEAKMSWRYIADYKKIMWLVSIAKDYCYSALESCEKALL